MLRITLTGGERLVESLRSKPVTIVNVLSSKLNALMFQLQSYIVQSKLSGGMLKRRTGILAGSIRTIPAEVAGPLIVAGVEGAGAAALYGKFFEEPSAGGTGGTAAHRIFATKARALSFVSGGQRIFAKSVMHPAMAARPFMTSSLAENAADIQAQLQAALDVELAKP